MSARDGGRDHTQGEQAAPQRDRDVSNPVYNELADFDAEVDVRYRPSLEGHDSMRSAPSLPATPPAGQAITEADARSEASWVAEVDHWLAQRMARSGDEPLSKRHRTGRAASQHPAATDYLSPAALQQQVQYACDVVPWLATTPPVADISPPNSPHVSATDILDALGRVHRALLEASLYGGAAADPRARACVAGAFPDALAAAAGAAPALTPRAVASAARGTALERLLGRSTHEAPLNEAASNCSSYSNMSSLSGHPEFTPEVAADALAVAAQVQPHAGRASVGRPPPAPGSLAAYAPPQLYAEPRGGDSSFGSAGAAPDGHGMSRMHDTLPAEGLFGSMAFSGPLDGLSGFSGMLNANTSGFSAALPATPREGEGAAADGPSPPTSGELSDHSVQRASDASLAGLVSDTSALLFPSVPRSPTANTLSPALSNAGLAATGSLSRPGTGVLAPQSDSTSLVPRLASSQAFTDTFNHTFSAENTAELVYGRRASRSRSLGLTQDLGGVERSALQPRSQHRGSGASGSAAPSSGGMGARSRSTGRLTETTFSDLSELPFTPRSPPRRPSAKPAPSTGLGAFQLRSPRPAPTSSPRAVAEGTHGGSAADSSPTAEATMADLADAQHAAVAPSAGEAWREESDSAQGQAESQQPAPVALHAGTRRGSAAAQLGDSKELWRPDDDDGAPSSPPSAAFATPAATLSSASQLSNGLYVNEQGVLVADRQGSNAFGTPRATLASDSILSNAIGSPHRSPRPRAARSDGSSAQGTSSPSLRFDGAVGAEGPRPNLADAATRSGQAAVTQGRDDRAAPVADTQRPVSVVGSLLACARAARPMSDVTVTTDSDREPSFMAGLPARAGGRTVSSESAELSTIVSTRSAGAPPTALLAGLLRPRTPDCNPDAPPPDMPTPRLAGGAGQDTPGREGAADAVAAGAPSSVSRPASVKSASMALAGQESPRADGPENGYGGVSVAVPATLNNSGRDSATVVESAATSDGSGSVGAEVAAARESSVPDTAAAPVMEASAVSTARSSASTAPSENVAPALGRFVQPPSTLNASVATTAGSACALPTEPSLSGADSSSAPAALPMVSPETQQDAARADQSTNGGVASYEATAAAFAPIAAGSAPLVPALQLGRVLPPTPGRALSREPTAASEPARPSTSVASIAGSTAPPSGRTSPAPSRAVSRGGSGVAASAAAAAAERYRGGKVEDASYAAMDSIPSTVDVQVTPRSAGGWSQPFTAPPAQQQAPWRGPTGGASVDLRRLRSRRDSAMSAASSAVSSELGEPPAAGAPPPLPPHGDLRGRTGGAGAAEAPQATVGGAGALEGTGVSRLLSERSNSDGDIETDAMRSLQREVGAPLFAHNAAPARGNIWQSTTSMPHESRMSLGSESGFFANAAAAAAAAAAGAAATAPYPAMLPQSVGERTRSVSDASNALWLSTGRQPRVSRGAGSPIRALGSDLSGGGLSRVGGGMPRTSSGAPSGFAGTFQQPHDALSAPPQPRASSDADDTFLPSSPTFAAQSGPSGSANQRSAPTAPNEAPAASAAPVDTGRDLPHAGSTSGAPSEATTSSVPLHSDADAPPTQRPQPPLSRPPPAPPLGADGATSRGSAHLRPPLTAGGALPSVPESPRGANSYAHTASPPPTTVPKGTPSYLQSWTRSELPSLNSSMPVSDAEVQFLSRGSYDNDWAPPRSLTPPSPHGPPRPDTLPGALSAPSESAFTPRSGAEGGCTGASDLAAPYGATTHRSGASLSPMADPVASPDAVDVSLAGSSYDGLQGASVAAVPFPERKPRPLRAAPPAKSATPPPEAVVPLPQHEARPSKPAAASPVKFASVSPMRHGSSGSQPRLSRPPVDAVAPQRSGLLACLGCFSQRNTKPRARRGPNARLQNMQQQVPVATPAAAPPTPVKTPGWKGVDQRNVVSSRRSTLQQQRESLRSGFAEQNLPAPGGRRASMTRR